MEFSAILAAAYEDLGYQSSPAADVVTRLKRYVNEGLQAIMGEPALAGLIEADTVYPFTSTTDRPQYGIPDAYAFVRHVIDSTNQRKLEAMTLDRYRTLDPMPSVHTGTPSHWVPIGRVPLALQPSDASAIAVKSTSASDTGNLLIAGIITGGYRRTETLAMTGATAAISTLATWIEITDVYMSAAAVGTVTIFEDTGTGTELARIAIGQKRPSYQGFYLWPTPAGAYDYTVDARRELDLLVNDTDEPPLPRDFHPMLVTYATFRDWTRKDDDRSGDAWERWKVYLSRLKYRLSQTGDALPVLGGSPRVGISRLGGFYPADMVIR